MEDSHEFYVCQPYICPYPKGDFPAGTRWTCPNCGAQYKMSKPKPERFWRAWSAPNGYWRWINRQGFTPGMDAVVRRPEHWR